MAYIDVIDSGPLSASEQMAHDQALIETLHERQKPLVRLYRFKNKSITYGYFQKIETLIDCEKALEKGIDIARRPTGGAALFHWNDFSFTVAMPSTHACFSDEVDSNYRLVNETLLQALISLQKPSDLHHYALKTENVGRSDFCMAQSSKYDLIWQGMKIGGASQRKTKFGFVHQGSLFFLLPKLSEVQAILTTPHDEIRAIKEQTSSIFSDDSSEEKIDIFSNELSNRFVDFFTKRIQSVL